MSSRSSSTHLKTEGESAILDRLTQRHLRNRILAPPGRYQIPSWKEEVLPFLASSRDLLRKVSELESTGSMPAILGFHEESLIVGDWDIQAPRVSHAFDNEALASLNVASSARSRLRDLFGPSQSRKRASTQSVLQESVEAFLSRTGVELMNEDIYNMLRGLEPSVDTLSASFLQTPPEIRRENKVCIGSSRGFETVHAFKVDEVTGFRCFVRFPL